MESPDITRRFFQSHVSMPDGSFAQPLTQIDFSYGRDGMLDTSGNIAVPHAFASPDKIVMDEVTFKATIDALTNKPTIDFFNSRKLNQNSKWAQTSMLMTNKFRTAGVLSILQSPRNFLLWSSNP